MSSTPLQQFSKKESAWRFLKLAIKLRAPQAAFHHVLLVLASHANPQGVCWPSHRLLMDQTGYTTPTTIVQALKHWKKAGVLTWRKGWGNAHGRRSNVYQFNEAAMWRQIGTQKAEFSTTTGLSDEQPLARDEQPLATDEQPLTGVGTTTRPMSKVSALEGTSNRTPQPMKEGFARLSSLKSVAECTPTESSCAEQPLNGCSYESTLNVHSSPAHDIPDALEYDHSEKRWSAKFGIGRSLTTAEIEQMRFLNSSRIRPAVH